MEHFQTLFSIRCTVSDSIIQQPMKEGMDVTPTLDEVIKATDQLKSGKAEGIDGIPPEIWKHGGGALHYKLHDLFIRCWEQG